MGLAKFMTLPCLCVSGNLFFGLRKQALPLGIVIATGIKYWRISCFQTITHKLEDAYRHVDFLSKLPKQRTVANRGDCRVFQIKKHFCSNFHQNKYFTLCAASVCPYIACWAGTLMWYNLWENYSFVIWYSVRVLIDLLHGCDGWGGGNFAWK